MTSAAHAAGSLRERSTSEPLAHADIGVVPIVWNNTDLPDLRPPSAAETILDEVARLGYAGIQLGAGFPTAPALRAQLASRGLRLAEAYVALPTSADGPSDAALPLARQRLAELDAAGGEVLVVALDRDAERDRWVGRAGSPPQLTDAGWRALAQLLDRLGDETHAMGRRLAFHNHAATFVERADEIECLATRTNAERVALCLDTGHAALAGADPVALLRRHGERVTHLHLKDLDPRPHAALQAGGLTGFDAALRARIFAPLGSGILELPALLEVLAARDYRGWLMVEQDTAWEPPSEAAAIGRRVLDAALRWTVTARHAAA